MKAIKKEFALPENFIKVVSSQILTPIAVTENSILWENLPMVLHSGGKILICHGNGSFTFKRDPKKYDTFEARTKNIKIVEISELAVGQLFVYLGPKNLEAKWNKAISVEKLFPAASTNVYFCYGKRKALDGKFSFHSVGFSIISEIFTTTSHDASTPDRKIYVGIPEIKFS